MNPDRVYRELADDALASQVEREDYGVFVAMPFANSFSYRSDTVFDQVITPAVHEASSLVRGRPFAEPLRSDRMAKSAAEITDEIIEGILVQHFFIADLTFANQGVLLETGVALALKPTKQIVLIAQGSLQDLHFDIRGNRVIRYDDSATATKEIAAALVAGAESFEDSLGERMVAMRRRLSPVAVYLMNVYGKLRLKSPTAALHHGVVRRDELLGDEGNRRIAFDAAVRELLERRLAYLDYEVADDGVNPDRFGLHATRLGLCFIRRTWPQSFAQVK